MNQQRIIETVFDKKVCLKGLKVRKKEGGDSS